MGKWIKHNSNQEDQRQHLVTGSGVMKNQLKLNLYWLPADSMAA